MTENKPRVEREGRCIVCGKKLEPYEIIWCTDCNPYTVKIAVNEEEIEEIPKQQEREKDIAILKLLKGIFTPRYDNRFIPRSDRQMYFLDILRKKKLKIQK